MFCFLKIAVFSIALIFSSPAFSQLCNEPNFNIQTSPGSQYWVNDYEGAVYLWSPTGTLQIVSGQGTSQVTVSGCGTLFVSRDWENYHCYDSIVIDCDLNFKNSCTPSFLVMDPNWNSSGETCPGIVLELGITSDCPNVAYYEWSIAGATIVQSGPVGGYIFVRTSPSVGTYLTFKVRAVYSNGTKSAWFQRQGITINCPGGGGL